MAAVAGAKTIDAGFTGDLETVEVTYDFAVDGGATGALDLLTCNDAMVIVHAWAKVVTACTSGGSATLIYGIKSGDTDAFLDATSGAVANLTAGAVLPNETTGLGVKVAAGGKVEMTIGTAALTAGKVKFCFLVQKF